MSENSAPVGSLPISHLSFEDYGNRYRHLDMQLVDGVLQVMLHDGEGGRVRFGGSPHPHGELTEAFYDIARDPTVRVVILTGAGGAFIESIDYGDQPPKLPATQVLNTQGLRLYQNQINIPVPMIAAIDGPAHVHAQLALICDIVVATPEATFRDAAHFEVGLVPGDSAHVLWLATLGHSRGRYFLLSCETIAAAEAKTLGFVHEIVPAAELLPRAWAIAREIAAKPVLTTRYSRAVLTQDLKNQLSNGMPYGLTAEILAGTEHWPSGIHPPHTAP